MNRLIRALRRLTHALGFDIRRWPPIPPSYRELAHFLEFSGIDTLLDVGANTGQYARHLRRAGYGGRIVSFEPASAPHAELVRMAMDDDAWDVAARMALGDEDGELLLNLFNRSDMNSALALSRSGEAAFPRLRQEGTETVPLRRLDAVFDDSLKGDRRTFLKIDTQGFEMQVLKGASGVMDRIFGIQAELSLFPLYDSEANFFEITEAVRSMGFELVMLTPVSYNRNLGRHIEIDAIFSRKT